MPPLLSSIPQPPFGSTPLARPSGNPGEAADGASMVGQAVDLLEKALSKLPPAHPGHKAVLTAISSLTKAVPPSARAPGIDMQGLKQLLAEKLRASPLAGLLAGQGGGAGGGMGAPPIPLGGGMPPVLPGAGAPAGGPM